MQDLKAMEQRLRESPDGQVSLTDPDARSMATSGRGTGMVGYNVQTAVDDTYHLIVAHEVTNVGNDRSQLTNMAGQARAATGIENLTVVADRGYFKSEEILQCDEAGITAFVPKPLTSAAMQMATSASRTSSTLPKMMSTVARSTAAHLAFHNHRAWYDAALLLEFGLFYLRNQKTMHIRQTGPPDKALGA